MDKLGSSEKSTKRTTDNTSSSARRQTLPTQRPPSEMINFSSKRSQEEIIAHAVHHGIQLGVNLSSDQLEMQNQQIEQLRGELYHTQQQSVLHHIHRENELLQVQLYNSHLYQDNTLLHAQLQNVNQQLALQQQQPIQILKREPQQEPPSTQQDTLKTSLTSEEKQARKEAKKHRLASEKAKKIEIISSGDSDVTQISQEESHKKAPPKKQDASDKPTEEPYQKFEKLYQQYEEFRQQQAETFSSEFASSPIKTANNDEESVISRVSQHDEPSKLKTDPNERFLEKSNTQETKPTKTAKKKKKKKSKVKNEQESHADDILLDQIISERSNPEKTSLFHNSFVKRDIDTVKKILNNKLADVNATDASGYTALQKACIVGDEEIVTLLLKDKLIRVNDKTKGEHNTSALHFACIYKHSNIVRILLDDKRVNVNAENDEASTPLTLACNQENTDVIKLLLAKDNIEINKSDKDGNTYLHRACMQGSLVVVKLLLAYPHIDVNARNNKGCTPLFLACNRGHTDIVQILLSDQLSVQRVNINAKDHLNITPLHISSARNHINVVKLLLDNQHIDVNVRENINGFTPLHLACKKQNVDIVKLLLDNKRVSVSIKDDDDNTPIFYANGNEDILDLFRNRERTGVN